MTFSEQAAARKAGLERMRVQVAKLVIGMPFLGAVAAVAWWVSGHGPGVAGIVMLAVMYFLRCSASRSGTTGSSRTRRTGPCRGCAR